jgi:hypothetical protein
VSRRAGFPPTGFLALGALSLIAAILFIVRAIGVEATAERIWSAVVFAGFSVFWLVAYASTRRNIGG